MSARGVRRLAPAALTGRTRTVGSVTDPFHRQDVGATQGRVAFMEKSRTMPRRRHIAWFGFLLAAAGLGGCPRDTLPDDFVRLMNLGKAHLENREDKDAIRVLTKAVKVSPASAPAHRNLARAYRLARQPERALASLNRAAELEPDSVATAYLRGLSLSHLTRFEEALPYLERAAQVDPHTPAVAFQLARLYEALGERDKAAEHLRTVVRLDPLHSSAHFKLATHARRTRDMDEFQRRMLEFRRLRRLFGDQTRTDDALEQCVHTEPEPAALVATARPTPSDSSIEVRFTDATATAFGTQADRRATAAAILDVDEAGRCTVFTIDEGGAVSLLTFLPEGGFSRRSVNMAPVPGGTFRTCLVGDFHNDVPKGAKYDPKLHALNDVLLAGEDSVRLLKRTGPSDFKDVTESAGLSGLRGLRPSWADYDHDGDVDLFAAAAGGLAVRQNNGDGRFSDVTASVGLGDTGSVTGVLAVDLDANIAIDLIATRDDDLTIVHMNRRAGRFAPLPRTWPMARIALADDLDNDGHVDVVLVSDSEVMVILGESATRPRIELADVRPTDAALIDYDNDGWLDLLVAGEKTAGGGGTLRLFRNRGSGGLVDVSETTGLANIAVGASPRILAADMDNDGDTDLLVVGSDNRMQFIRNDGGSANGQLKLRLVSTKSNPTGLGVHVEYRDGPFLLTRSVGRIPIEIGLGGRRRLDSIQTVWTNGVVDNRIDVSISAAPLTIIEKNVPTGSCPFLYVWDGSRFRFVTDLLGNSPIGLPLRRDVMLPADVDEIVIIGPAESFVPRDGAYTVVLTDEFREVFYLDYARLIAVDHPPAQDVYSTDKLMPEPFPPSQVWALGAPKPPVAASGDDGIDRTAAVSQVDGVFAPPGSPLPPPFRGMCQPIALTLDFGPLPTDGPSVLAMTGWLQYGDASTNIAMSQSSALTIISPTLEAETSAGQWQPVDLVVGMPAGKTKTILCDLAGKLPPGTRRLRLTTTFEIRWDRIALFERRALPPSNVHELAPDAADFQWRGFSDMRARVPGGPMTPDFDTVTDAPPWRTTPEGWCTRYGDVLELVMTRDDRLVLINAGDGLELRFKAAQLPPVPHGLVRTFLFYSVGWDKDGDHNVPAGDRVGPLPTGTATDAPGATRHDGDWRLRYNTRYVKGDRFSPH